MGFKIYTSQICNFSVNQHIVFVLWTNIAEDSVIYIIVLSTWIVMSSANVGLILNGLMV